MSAEADTVVPMRPSGSRKGQDAYKGSVVKQLDLLNVMHAATKIVSARVMTLVAMMMTFGLFCWAMWLGSNLALITSAAFGCLVFLPVLAADRTKGGSHVDSGD